MFDLDKLLKEAADRGASDIHLKVGNYPYLRVEGDLLPLEEYGRLGKEVTSGLVDEILNPVQKKVFDEASEVDLSFGVRGVGRFRAAFYEQRGSISASMRLIAQSVPTLEELHLPEVLREISDSLRGLVLVTGITGSGKSTTMASMIRHLNETTTCHILTIEDPIEFLFRDQRSIISQREVSRDTSTYTAALRAAMRQDPDVIMVGEMRDVETIGIALQAAQTGHLVMSTLHTTDAVMTVDRVISLFPVSQQRDIRLQFASALNSIVSIRLIRSSTSGHRYPAVEVLRSTELIRTLISDPQRTKEIRPAMESGLKESGMQTFDQSILQHYFHKLISREDALRYATSPDNMRLKMKGIVDATEEV